MPWQVGICLMVSPGSSLLFASYIFYNGAHGGTCIWLGGASFSRWHRDGPSSSALKQVSTPPDIIAVRAYS